MNNNNIGSLLILLALLVIAKYCNGQARLTKERLCPHLFGDTSVSNELRQRFSPGQLDAFCERHSDWDQGTKIRSDSNKKSVTPTQAAWLNSIWSCENLACLCKLDASAGCDKLVSMVQDISVDPTAQFDIPFKDEPLRQFPGRGRRRRQAGMLTKLIPVTRKEYRMLTETERSAFHHAMNVAKTQMVDQLSKYDLLTLYHTPEYSPGAHFGPALLPFHRELLKQMELVLRSIDATVGMPYWDSTLDEPLPSPQDSILFTDLFFGSTDGTNEVSDGPYNNWRTASDLAVDHLSTRRKIVRSLGTSPYGGLFRPDDIERILNIPTFANLTYCVDPYFELVHGTVHMWIGGHMGTLRISPNDPTFFLLHSHVDYIWEKWRARHQTRSQRTVDYVAPDQVCTIYHAGDHDMQPFKVKNKDGLSNKYLDELYTYQDSPTCSLMNTDCGSPYLWCDTTSRLPRCVSKVRPDGNCTGYDSRTPICYEGTCLNSRCVRSAGKPLPVTLPPLAPQTQPPPAPVVIVPQPTTTTSTSTTTIPPTTTTRLTTTSTTQQTQQPVVKPIDTSFSTDNTGTVWFPMTTYSVKNGAILPLQNGRILTTHDDGLVLEGIIMPSSTPKYFSGASAAQVSNPYQQADGLVRAQITVLDESGRACVSMCLHDADVIPWRYKPCTTSVTFSTDARQSDNIAFTPYKEQLMSLAWSGNKKVADPFMFICHSSPPNVNPEPTTPTPTTTTLRWTNPPQPVVTQSPNSFEDPDCVDNHRCCPLWSVSSSFACQDAWIKSACSKSCQICIPANSDPSDGVSAIKTNRLGAFIFRDSKQCTDKFADCTLWARSSQCSINQDWMETNCAKSCGVCDQSLDDLKDFCSGSKLTGTCRDRLLPCATWSRQGECQTNRSWMARNCSYSCKVCSKK